MAQVRAALGADALILANRRRGSQVEITAAADIDTQLDAAPRHGMPYALEGQDNELQMKALERELNRLRGMLEGELARGNWRDSARRPAPQATVLQRLRRLGLSRGLAGDIVDGLPARDLESLWRLALAALAARLPRARPLPPGPVVVACFGSTGVGKTTTLAKLAAQDVLRLGRDAVGLISLDQQRMGAREQLASFADALSLPVLMAEDPRSLQQALARLRNRPRIYIDTAGLAQHDVRLAAQRALIDQLPCEVHRLLVLSAVSQPSQGRALVERLGPQHFAGAIITKVDESAALGGVLDVLAQGRIPVQFVSEGQRVPEDLRTVDSGELVALAADVMQREQQRARTAASLRAAG
jgi:flagellar biosynthesis protein FlhF